MLTPLYKENRESSSAKMSYRIQSSTVTAPQGNATRSRACKDAREQNSFNVHKSWRDETLKNIDPHREVIETPKIHSSAQECTEKGPKGAESSQNRLEIKRASDSKKV